MIAGFLEVAHPGIRIRAKSPGQILQQSDQWTLVWNSDATRSERRGINRENRMDTATLSASCSLRKRNRHNGEDAAANSSGNDMVYVPHKSRPMKDILIAYRASELVHLKTSGALAASWTSSQQSRTRHTNSTKIS